MDKAKKLNIEEAFCEYLAKNFRGAVNPVSSKTLEAVFHVKGTEIRRIVNSLRCKGCLLYTSVAGAAYQAGEKLFSEYDQKMKNYLYKKEVVYTEVMLPTNCLLYTSRCV